MNLKVSFFFLVFIIVFDTKSFSENILSEKLIILLEDTYNFSPKLRAEREVLFEKDELLPQAFSEFRPVIDGYYNKGKIDTAISGSNFIADGVRTETNAGIKITQPIFNGGSTLNSIANAENRIQSQRYKLKYTEQDVFLESIKLFSSIAAKKKEVLLNKKRQEFLKKKFDLAQNQFDIGEITLTDVSISKARLSLAKSDLIKSESDLFALSAKYMTLVGTKPNDPELYFNFPPISSELDELIQKSIIQNPKLLGITFGIKSLNSQVKMLYSSKLPSVKLEAELKKNKGYFRSDSSREVMSAFASISVPIYEAGVASSKMRELKKRASSEKELRKVEINELKYNITNSWSNYNSSLSKIEAYTNQIKANEKYLEGLNQELMLGERTLLDILDAEEELIESEYNLIKSYEENFNSYYEILFFLGDLDAKKLGLKVDFFDELENYNNVKFKWLDIIE